MSFTPALKDPAARAHLRMQFGQPAGVPIGAISTVAITPRGRVAQVAALTVAAQHAGTDYALLSLDGGTDGELYLVECLVSDGAGGQIEAARQTANVVITEARRKEAAERQASDAIRKAQSSQRVGMAQVGMQANDVAVQWASGTSAGIIFAQQANQVGYALSMMGGTAGRVGAIFAGPWGAAITVAVMGLSLLSGRAGEAGGMADFMADRYGAAGERVAQTFVDPVNDAIDSIGQLLDMLGNRLVDGIMNDLDLAARGLAWFKGQVDALLSETAQLAITKAAQTALNPVGTALDLARWATGKEAPVRDRAAERAGRRADQALAATPASAQFNSLTGFDPFDKDKLRDFGRAVQQEARAAEREAQQLADAATREAKRAGDAAVREAKRVAEAQAKFMEGMVAAAAKAANTDLFRPGMAAEQFDRQDKARKSDDLARAVGQAENNIDAAREQAKAQADAFNKEVLGHAATIGAAIGGSAGESLTAAIGALVVGDKGALSGLRGPQGVIARGLAPTLQSREFKDAVAPLVKTFKTVFGDQPFGKELGKALEALGFGSAVASIIGKGSKEEQIGGAVGGGIGSAIGSIYGPLGEAVGKVVGSVLGTVVGGLFVKAKTGSVSLSGSGGVVVQGDPTGTGGTQVQNAGVLGNNFTNALNSIVEQLGGTIGNFAVSIGQNGNNYRVDTTGAGRTRKKQAGVLAFGEDANAAVQAALADAIRDGAVAGVSPRVQSVLKQYAENLDRAVAEALKVQNLENWLADRENPFASAMRDFERQAAERVRVARQYGFDVVEIEKANAEERAKAVKETASSLTAGLKALLDDIRYGSRAEGSVSERLTSLGAERSRLQGLIDGGDTSQIDALAAIIQQQYDLRKEAFGSTGEFASGRGETITTLEQLIRQTEDRVAAASTAAQNLTNDKLSEANTTLDEQMTEMQRQTAALNEIVMRLSGGGGITAGLLALYGRSAV